MNQQQLLRPEGPFTLRDTGDFFRGKNGLLWLLLMQYLLKPCLAGIKYAHVSNVMTIRQDRGLYLVVT